MGEGATDVAIGMFGAFGTNVISGNLGPGVYVSGANTQVSIAENLIGTDMEAVKAIPNQIGVQLAEGVHDIEVASNTIVANTQHGVLIDSGAHHNELRDNEIAGNGAHGVAVVGDTSLYNQVRGNIITGNNDFGIRLIAGGNSRLPAPIIDYLSIDGGIIKGRVASGVPRGSVVDVYADVDDEGEE